MIVLVNNFAKERLETETDIEESTSSVLIAYMYIL